MVLKPKPSDKCEWSYSDWSDCDSSKTKTRNVNCKNSKGLCSQDNCKDTKPANTQACTDPDACSWVYSDWSSCTINTNNQTRTVTCTNTSGTPCDNSKCTGTIDDLTRQCVLSCCDKSSTIWNCNTSLDKTCPEYSLPTYDCNLCTNNIFPDNVYIFTQNDAISTNDMQSKINNAFWTQGGVTPDNNGQNSNVSYAFLFMPGTYKVDIPIGYYTHVAGLSETSDQVIINGGPVVNNGSSDHKIGALNTFWRSCENMTVNPKNATTIYAVSQACSLRSVNINGNLQLSAMADDGQMGFSSGGFLANCKISGMLDMSSQQQFICRNTDYGTFPNVLWNQVNIGCTSSTTPRLGCCISTPTTALTTSKNLTVVDKTPLVKEKPYLAYTGTSGVTDRNIITQNISVMRPELKPNSSGIDTRKPTSFISIINYKIISATTTDSGEIINNILKDTKIQCIIFSPGRYTIKTPIKLSGQLLFGLGVPVLRSGNNNNIIVGYGELCGIIFEADSTGSGTNTLVNLTTKQPSYLWDISCRVGGGDNARSTDIYHIDTMLYVGGDNSILDNVWCWVADHYSSNDGKVAWDNAICHTAVHVKGDNVIAYGLFTEHTRDRNVYWEGDNGQVYMFQSEFNYYPPSQGDFNNKVSYEIASTVNNHKLYGAGPYSYFPGFTTPEIMADAGFTPLDI